MSLSHVEVAIDWAAAEGWNPGLHDAQCFFAIDPRGFYMGMLDGRMIASVAIPIYADEFAFIGLYIVEPEYRGRGFGLALTKLSFAISVIAMSGWMASRRWRRDMHGSAIGGRIAVCVIAFTPQRVVKH